MITKDMTVGEVIRVKEDADKILMSFGMGCIGCPSAQSESLEDAAEVHGFDVETLLEALNK